MLFCNPTAAIQEKNKNDNIEENQENLKHKNAVNNFQVPLQ